MNNSLTAPIRLSNKLLAYLQLARPANVVTAWADILAGYAASGLVSSPDLMPLFWLLLSTSGLYAGGVTFNDVFDAELDATERPERPIPSDRISQPEAIALGSVLLTVGIFAAAKVSLLSSELAIAIALLALLYDGVGKHRPLLGPLNMGLCRGGNLLLGMSAAGELSGPWFLLCIPLLYIGAVTAISRGEVQGGERKTGIVALFLLAATFCGLLLIGYWPTVQFWRLVPFTLLLMLMTLPPFVRAMLTPDAMTIRAAVKAGVLSLIVVDATLAAGFSGELYGLCVLALLPLSVGVARLFAVT